MTTSTKDRNAAALAGNNGFSLISNEKLLQLYSTMVKCRGNSAADQVAAAVGVTIDLLPEDTVVALPGDFDFLQGHIRPHEKSGRRSSPAAQLKMSIGAAIENKEKKNGKIAVVFSSGDSGFPHEALIQAGAQQLPILFVCPTNLPAKPLLARKRIGVEQSAADVYGFPFIPVDGVDVVAVYRVATEAIAHARKGNGSTLIECKFDGSGAHDPITKMEDYLTRKGLFSAKVKRKVVARHTAGLDAAFETAAGINC
ncbi:MAG: thiamine pyrophosphate-dependent enzyme [Terracidiphilus sp.]|jgi:TPP-dependent pyruvate/acetoin dehydrogenase alpha subunit